jgi:hypothetical protein
MTSYKTQATRRAKATRHATRMQAADYGFDYVLPSLAGALGAGLLAYAGTQFYRRGRHS